MLELTYLGTAMLDLRLGNARFVTDPALDPRGTQYDFGFWFTPASWFASQKQYETPAVSGHFDAALLSHDHHADNLDFAGRAMVADEAKVARVITTPAGARRLARPRREHDRPGLGLGLGARVSGLVHGNTTRVGDVTVTAMIARHGPPYAPQVHQVTGFLLDVEDGPRVWISGDTVMFPALAAALEEIGKRRPVDVAVVHCGAVAFPRALGFRHARFTFDAAEAAAACKLVGARTIIPIHRSGWAHFRQPETTLAAELERAGLGERVRMLPLGDRFTL
ncbi:MAG: MBL fold metallo-hydrolase [Kofleriaceae bacterium]|nr:MBL fold metallo-hydrolase [Kofleriaceae bacterium]